MAKQDFYVDVDLHKQQLLQSRFENVTTFPTTPGNGQFVFLTGTVAGYPINNAYMWNGSDWLNLSQVVTGAVTLKGEITNANTSPAYPVGPAIGDMYIVSTNAGTVGGQPVEIGDELIYSTTGWFILQRNITDASTTVKGFIRLATQSEVIAGSDATSAVTPATLAGYLVNYLYARKVRVFIPSLLANTLTDITHGLNVANAEDVVVNVWQGSALIVIAVTSSTVNKIQVQSNVALSNVVVIIQG